MEKKKKSQVAFDLRFVLAKLELLPSQRAGGTAATSVALMMFAATAAVVLLRFLIRHFRPHSTINRTHRARRARKTNERNELQPASRVKRKQQQQRKRQQEQQKAKHSPKHLRFCETLAVGHRCVAQFCKFLIDSHKLQLFALFAFAKTRRKQKKTKESLPAN